MYHFGTFHHTHTASATAGTCAAAAASCANTAAASDVVVGTAMIAVSIFVILVHLCKELRISSFGDLCALAVLLLLAVGMYLCSRKTYRAN